MNSTKQHTFVIIAYKDSKYIEDLILSLKSQTIQSNIIISTSTPSEFLYNIAKKYDLELFINSESNGIASDWSFAYKQCNTKYLTLAHQDDIYLSEYTESLLKNSRKIPNNIILFSYYSELFIDRIYSNNFLLFFKKVLLFPFLFKSAIKTVFFKKMVLSFGQPISCPSVMYNKEIIGDFIFNSEFENNLDWEAFFRLVKLEGYFLLVKQNLMIHRIHNETATSKAINTNIRYNEDKKMFEKIWGKTISQIIMKIYSFSYKSNSKKL